MTLNRSLTTTLASALLLACPGPDALQSPLSPELVGEWSSGGVSTVDFYNPSTGSWAAPSGAGASYEFAPDGTYVYAAMLQSSLYSCTMTVFWSALGVAYQDGQHLTLTELEGTVKSTHTCRPEFNYQREELKPVRTFAWRIHQEESEAPQLMLWDGEQELPYRWTR
jgi:hypothetical protein